ncbi:hypothetical protein HER39_00675 [Arthrobacter deserti]|uniref:Acyltransferase n=1 Tax=Arthrobacter deserti TaxID=1742687 RepID=A0ABX1JIG7_9MICC|nr:hypothetical protein [Arthrobacter deserti]
MGILLRVLTSLNGRLPRPHVRIGRNSSIDPRVRFLSGKGRPITIGDGAIMIRYTEICGPVVMGDNMRINRDVYIRPNTTIGNNVGLRPFCPIITGTHQMGGADKRVGPVEYRPITIGDGVWVGAGATILAGVRVGAGAMIAAGALVNRDVPPNAVMAGVPAKVRAVLDASGRPLPTSAKVAAQQRPSAAPVPETAVRSGAVPLAGAD